MIQSGRSTTTRVRLVSAIIAIALTGFVVTGVVAFTMQRDRIVATVDERLNDQVEALANTLESDEVRLLTPSDPVRSTLTAPPVFVSVGEMLYYAVSHLAPGSNETAFALVNGVPAYEAETASSFDMTDDDNLIERIVKDVVAANAPIIDSASTSAGSLRFIAIPVQLGTTADVGIYVHVIDLDAYLDPLYSSLFSFATIVIVSLIAIGAACWIVLGRKTSRSDSAFEHGDLPVSEPCDPVVPPADPLPIVASVGSANEILERIEGSADAQRQLLDDVRHELKTPITIVRGYLEIMNVHDPLDVQTAREIGISELDRMTRLVEDIDTLATVEGDEYTMGTIDIARLTARVGELVSVIPGHPWHVTRVADGIVRGNQDRVLQAWLALCNNAAKYTPAGSPIEIGSVRAIDAMMLWVRDRGPGIPPAARHRIFRRFDRGSGKREVGGSGLGLAIVDVIARAHGGSCSVSETPGGGATFTIRLPLRLGGASALPAPVRAGDVVQQREEQE